jgi:hypothetical protein
MQARQWRVSRPAGGVVFVIPAQAGSRGLHGEINQLCSPRQPCLSKPGHRVPACVGTTAGSLQHGIRPCDITCLRLRARAWGDHGPNPDVFSAVARPVPQAIAGPAGKLPRTVARLRGDGARFHATWNRAVRRHVPRATSRISASHTRMAWPTIRIPLFPARAQGLCQAPVARQERFQDSNAPARGRRSVPCNMESGCETSRASCDVTHLGLAYTHGVAHDPNPAVPGEGAGPVPSPRRPCRKTSGDGSASSRGRRPVPRGTESGRGTSGAFGFSLLPAAARCRRRRWPACRPSAPPGCGW